MYDVSTQGVDECKINIHFSFLFSFALSHKQKTKTKTPYPLMPTFMGHANLII